MPNVNLPLLKKKYDTSEAAGASKMKNAKADCLHFLIRQRTFKTSFCVGSIRHSEIRQYFLKVWSLKLKILSIPLMPSALAAVAKVLRESRSCRHWSFCTCCFLKCSARMRRINIRRLLKLQLLDSVTVFLCISLIRISVVFKHSKMSTERICFM